MNKKTVLQIVLDLIFIAVFNTVFFVACEAKQPASVWIAYGFIHFSYLTVLIMPFLTRKGSSEAILKLPLESISSGYFLIEFIVGVIFVFLKSESYKASLIVQVIIAGLYGIVLISHLLANEHTADSLERREAEGAYIKNTASRVKALIGRLDDRKADKKIEEVYDLLHSSPSKSNESVHSLENEIVRKITELEDAVYASDSNMSVDISAQITELAEKRNRKISLEN